MPKILPFSQLYHVRVEISADVCPETGLIIITAEVVTRTVTGILAKDGYL